MKIQVLLLAATLFTISASAQTKKIAHRSHSGSDVTFSTASDEDNFGIVYRVPDSMKRVKTPPSDAAMTDSVLKQRAAEQEKKNNKNKAKASKKTK